MTIQQAVLVLSLVSMVCGETALCQTGTLVRNQGASIPVRRVPDTGQRTDYTQTFGEDSDYLINPPSLTVNGDGTVADGVTGLLWQKTDGGEMTFAAAIAYCDTLTLGNQTDWRLPTAREVFGILHHDRLNPALDTSSFTKSAAEYWWSGDRRVDDSTRIWVANAGGGIGPHPMSETMSAGGTKRFHVRAVCDASPSGRVTARFRQEGDSTVTDQSTGLMWQRFRPPGTRTWEEALSYGESVNTGGYSDWRVPTIKELESLNDENRSNPSIDPAAFPGFAAGRYWSS